MTLWEKIGWYRNAYGLRALMLRVVSKCLGDPMLPGGGNDLAAVAAGTTALPSPGVTDECVTAPAARSADSIVADQFPALGPLPVYTVPGMGPRINLVTDSVGSGSLFGGVGTSIILATLLARETGARLRIVTRKDVPDLAAVSRVLQCNGIEYQPSIEAVHVPLWGIEQQLAIDRDDRFITTSWWTTASVLGSVPPSKVDYLLQEDERMFYPHGDEWLRCCELLSRDDIRYIVNTGLLKTHLVSSGLGHLAENAVAFEPAFPEGMFSPGPRRVDGKRILFFYARPSHDRNLYLRGLEALDIATRQGIFEPDEWEVVFAGERIPPLRLGDRLEPTILGKTDWKSYGDFVKTVDLGFCLMATPHPSYPPLDLAACGATVLTNRFGLKQDLHGYSANISCVGLELESLVKGLQEAASRAKNDQARKANYRRQGLERSWEKSLRPVLERMGAIPCS